MLRTLLAASAITLAAPAFAGTLIVNDDWAFDVLGVAGNPTVNSPWSFTATRPSVFRLLDCCVPGDVWRVSGDIAGVSSFYVGGPLPPQLSPWDEWFSADYSKLQIKVAPGTYSFSVTGDGAGGLPAGVWLSVTDVPEPATWALLITGFGLVGSALRRRKPVAA